VKTLGPSFIDEVQAAGLGGLPFTWGATDDTINVERLTEAQKQLLATVVAAHASDASEPQTVLSQDLMAQFTVDDIAAIQTAITSNTQAALLWYSLLAQREPMRVTNVRFRAGWSTLVSVLGATRMAEIATALGITVQP
jgi:hypothetical protein